MHAFSEKTKSIKVIVPASGRVPALEPVLSPRRYRDCHGSGNADRELPMHPTGSAFRQTIRVTRCGGVWLSDEEDKAITKVSR